MVNIKRKPIRPERRKRTYWRNRYIKHRRGYLLEKSKSNCPTAKGKYNSTRKGQSEKENRLCPCRCPYRIL